MWQLIANVIVQQDATTHITNTAVAMLSDVTLLKLAKVQLNTAIRIAQRKQLIHKVVIFIWDRAWDGGSSGWLRILTMHERIEKHEAGHDARPSIPEL